MTLKNAIMNTFSKHAIRKALCFDKTKAHINISHLYLKHFESIHRELVIHNLNQALRIVKTKALQ